MIPPFLATLGGKIGLGVLSAVVIAGAIYAYNERLRSQGDVRTEAKYHEQIQEQHEIAKEATTILDDQRLLDVERAVKEKDQFNAKLVQINRAKDAEIGKLKSALENQTPEVRYEVEYVPIEVEKPAPCVASEQLADRVDELARLLNDLSNDHLPGDRRAAEESVVRGSGPVACDTLVQRIEVLTSRLGKSMIEHRRLTNYVMRQYEIYQAFKKGLKD